MGGQLESHHVQPSVISHFAILHMDKGVVGRPHTILSPPSILPTQRPTKSPNRSFAIVLVNQLSLKTFHSTKKGEVTKWYRLLHLNKYILIKT